MKPSCLNLYEAMQRGEEISVKTSIMRYGISAAGQRCGDLRRKYGKPIAEKWAVAPNGARYLIWYLKPEDRGPYAPKTETIVRAHTRRLANVIEDGMEPVQENLFA